MYVAEDGFEITEEKFLQFANVNGYNLINRISEEQHRLKQLYSSSGMTEDEFYKSVMLDYSKKISQLIIQDYGEILEEETKAKIEKFISTNESIVFLDRKDFPEISVDGKTPSAFARNEEGKVYYPNYDRSVNLIEFVRKQEQTLTHEIFHIVTKNNLELQNLLLNNEIVGTYKPGALFNEALVEKSARDFATRHNLMYHPVVEYIQYVRSLELFMNKYGIQKNSQMFNRSFNEVIHVATPQEQQQYYAFEQKHNLKRFGKKSINNGSYTLSQETREQTTQNQTQLINPKKRVRTLNNSNITSNNNGFVSVMILLITGIVVVLGIILAYLLI